MCNYIQLIIKKNDILLIMRNNLCVYNIYEQLVYLVTLFN